MAEQLYHLGHGLVSDDWQHLDAEQDLPQQGQVILPYARWQQDKAAASKRPNLRLAVALDNTQDVEALDADVLDLPMIALDFPVFGDGRAFSQARLLRERLGYKGQIRATGDVHSDQLLYMARCGFDAFALAEATPLPRIEQALAEFSVAYQATASGPEMRRAG